MKNYVLFLLLLFSRLEAEIRYPTTISENIWHEVSPFMLPDDHPIKKKLDTIFSEPDVIKDTLSFYRAGFHMRRPANARKIIVATHRDLNGYIFKLFLDSQEINTEWQHFLKRIYGSKLIRKTIEEKAYTASFKVPYKWLYLIPNKTEGRKFILIAEDMNLLPHLNNKATWKNQMTYEQVYMLWDIFETCGLYDSVYIHNVPFCKDLKMAFVDTEDFYHWPVPYNRLNKHFSKAKRQFWKKITNQD